MDLYKEILVKLLEKEEIHIIFPNLKINPAESVEGECFKALQKIKAVIDNDGLSDFDCSEAITQVFEELGSDVSRHDFG